MSLEWLKRSPVAAKADAVKPVRMQCGHDVYPPETWGYHAGLFWDDEGIDTCDDCKMTPAVWWVLMDSFSRYQRRVWDEAAWYVAEKDHVIAEQNASIEFLENELQGEL